MNETRIHIMRFIVVLLLFQFMAPAFTLVNTQGIGPNREACIWRQKCHSLIIPVLLKEKEETESRGDDSFADCAPLIDFSAHTCVLAAFHTARSTPFIHHHPYDHRPPLFTLHRSFLI